MSRKRKDIPKGKTGSRKSSSAKVDRSFQARGLSCIIVPPTAKNFPQPRVDTSIKIFEDGIRGEQIKRTIPADQMIRKLRAKGIIT